MPNTLTTIFRSMPSTEPVEAPHPNTGVYTTGTQLADGTWQVIHTGITKTTTPPTMAGRLKNYPSVGASIVASGNILNIQQAKPTGTSAVGSSATSINVTANSSANATYYRFLSATALAGPYTVLTTQASAIYAHTGLASGAVVWYQMQYVGSGFYDDSPVSDAFSGTATVASVPLVLTAAYLRGNATDEDYSTVSPGLRRYSPLSYSVPFSVTGAGPLIFQQYSDVQLGVLGGYVTMDGGSPQYLTNTAAGNQNFTLQNPTGTHTWRYYAGNAQRVNDAGNVLIGGQLRQIDFGGLSYTVGTLPAAVNGFYDIGDSISVSVQASAVDKGWMPRLRQQLDSTWETVTDGYGYRGIIPSFSPAGNIAAQVTRVRAFMAGRTGRRVVMIDLETNDYGLPYGSAATYGTVLTQLVDAILADNASYEVWIKTAINRYDQTAANSFGSLLNDFTTQILALPTSRPRVVVQNASGWLVQTDLSTDKLHPSDSGYATLEGFIYGTLFPSAYSQPYQPTRTSYALVRNSDTVATSTFSVYGRFTASDVTTAYQQIAGKATLDTSTGNQPHGSFGVYLHLNELHATAFGAVAANTTDVNVSGMVSGVDYGFVFTLSGTATTLYVAPSGGTGTVQKTAPYSGVTSVQTSTDKISFGALFKINPTSFGSLFAGLLGRGGYVTRELSDTEARTLLASGCVPASGLAGLAIDTDFKIIPGGSTAQNFIAPANLIDIVPIVPGATPSPTPTTVRANDTRFTVTAGFVQDAGNGGDAYSNTYGATLTYQFTASGTTADMLINMLVNGGRISMALNGATPVVMATAASAVVVDNLLYSFTGLTVGQVYTLVFTKGDNDASYIAVGAVRQHS